VFSVAAAILAAVEGGILPPGKNARLFGDLQIAGRFGYAWACSAGQDARLYGRRDARRYMPSLPPPAFAFIRVIRGFHHCLFWKIMLARQRVFHD